MKPLTLRPRILGALELAPMTSRELAHTLMANLVSIRHYVDELRNMRIVSACGKRGCHEKVWRIVQ